MVAVITGLLILVAGLVVIGFLTRSEAIAENLFLRPALARETRRAEAAERRAARLAARLDGQAHRVARLQRMAAATAATCRRTSDIYEKQRDAFGAGGTIAAPGGGQTRG